MRRSRRLSGLAPSAVPRALERAPKKKTTTNRSSSKKENIPPSRSAVKAEKTTSRTKRNASASTRASSKKKTTPKRSATPKRGRPQKPKAPAASARPRSRKAAVKKQGSKKKATPRSRSAKRAATTSKPRTKTPKVKRSVKKSTASIHRKTPKQTPAARNEEEEKTTVDEEETFPPAPMFVDEDEDGVYVPDDWKPRKVDWGHAEMDVDTQTSKKTDGHSMDLTMVGIVFCLIALYLVSFCRSMSCPAFTKLPTRFSSLLTEFDVGATAVTSFVLYIVSLAYCRSWLTTDGYLTAEEGSFITLHFCHGLLVVLHLVCCSVMDPSNQKANCAESIVALSMGFYAAAWAMQLRFSMQFLRNSIALAYLCLFYYQGKNAFGFVLALAAKSVFWMTGAHMMEIVNNERWSLIDLVLTVACGFLAYLVPPRV